MALVQFSTTTHYVLPTRNDVAPSGYEGFGRVLQELTLAPHLDALAGKGNWIVDGFALPGTGTGTTGKPITAGEAIIEGYRVATHSTGFSVNFPYVTNYVYLVLLTSLGKITEVVVEVNDTATQPSNSVFLGEVTTGGGDITAVVDRRPMRFATAGAYVGNGASTRSIVVPDLGTNYPNFLIISQWTITDTTTVAFILRCFAERDVVVNVVEGVGAGVTDYAAETFMESGGFVVGDTLVTNSNTVQYHYRILA